jgi:hypothetical protein
MRRQWGDAKRDGGKPLATKAGAALDARAEQRMTDDAEAGVDPATLARRHAGRPSLSGSPGHSHRVDLRVDDETYRAIRRIADEGSGSISDVVRDAIRRYLDAS